MWEHWSAFCFDWDHLKVAYAYLKYFSFLKKTTFICQSCQFFCYSLCNQICEMKHAPSIICYIHKNTQRNWSLQMFKRNFKCAFHSNQDWKFNAFFLFRINRPNSTLLHFFSCYVMFLCEKIIRLSLIQSHSEFVTDQLAVVLENHLFYVENT